MLKTILKVLTNLFSFEPGDLGRREVFQDLEWKKNKVRMMIQGRILWPDRFDVPNFKNYRWKELNLRKFIFTFFLFATTGIAACSHKDGSTKSTDSAPPEVKRYLVNGETPEVYYSNFLYLRAKHCPNPWYRMAGTFSFPMGKDELGRRLGGDLYILMLENGMYQAYYTETSFGERTSYGTPILAEVTQKFSGKWRIDGLDIDFEGIGRGYAVLDNGRRKIHLRVERNIIREVLKDQTLEISIMYSTNAKIPELDNCAR